MVPFYYIFIAAVLYCGIAVFLYNNIDIQKYAICHMPYAIWWIELSHGPS